MLRKFDEENVHKNLKTPEESKKKSAENQLFRIEDNLKEKSKEDNTVKEERKKKKTGCRKEENIGGRAFKKII